MFNFYSVLPAHAHKNSQKKHKEKKNKEVKMNK